MQLGLRLSSLKPLRTVKCRPDTKLTKTALPHGLLTSRRLKGGNDYGVQNRRVVAQSSSELELEALRNTDVLERISFGVVNRVFSKEELDLLFETYSANLIVLMCKAKYCRPCMAFAKKYTRLAEEFQDVLFLEIMGDENRATRMLMVDFEVKATPTFRYYLDGKCLTTSVGIKLEKIQETVQFSKPMQNETH